MDERTVVDFSRSGRCSVPVDYFLCFESTARHCPCVWVHARIWRLWKSMGGFCKCSRTQICRRLVLFGEYLNLECQRRAWIVFDAAQNCQNDVHFVNILYRLEANHSPVVDIMLNHLGPTLDNVATATNNINLFNFLQIAKARRMGQSILTLHEDFQSKLTTESKSLILLIQSIFPNRDAAKLHPGLQVRRMRHGQRRLSKSHATGVK